MKAAIYARISADKTGEQAGVTRQLEDCRAEAARAEWTVVEEYVDNDISATSGKVRPAYRAMLAAIEAGEIEAVVTWAPDRLYRKARDLEPLIDVMEKAGAAIRTVRAGEIDLATPTGRMIARITGAVATQEGEQKADRWLRSIRQRREQGQAPGWGPRLFGYTRTGDVIEAEAEAIRQAATELIAGRTIRSTATWLNDKGFTSTQGNPWSTQALKKLMENARLAGHSTLNGDTVGVSQWPAILDEETFTQLQAVLSLRRGSAETAPRVSLLLGLAHCAVCEAPLKSARDKKKPGQAQGQRRYRCLKQPGLPGKGCVTINAEPLEEMVEAGAKARLADPRVREQLERLSAASGENAAEIIGLEERITELEAQLPEPGVPVDAIMRAIRLARDRVNSLQGAAIPVGPLPRGDWPEELGRRARLVRLVIADVKVDKAAVVGRNAFDPGRVEIVPR